jgi:hypothetical protein
MTSATLHDSRIRLESSVGVLDEFARATKSRASRTDLIICEVLQGVRDEATEISQ